MNAKLAKRLRREARAVTPGLADRNLVVKLNRKTNLVTGETTQTVSAVQANLSTRGVYREMKRRRRAGLNF